MLIVLSEESAIIICFCCGDLTSVYSSLAIPEGACYFILEEVNPAFIISWCIGEVTLALMVELELLIFCSSFEVLFFYHLAELPITPCSCNIERLIL